MEDRACARARTRSPADRPRGVLGLWARRPSGTDRRARLFV